MSANTFDTENYEDSVIKCKQINEVVPKVCDGIKQMQRLDNRFGKDYDLKVADQLLQTLLSLRRGEGEEATANYVNEFRNCLISGLNSLGHFFVNFTHPEMLSEEQRSQFSQVAANIATTQETISNIASH